MAMKDWKQTKKGKFGELWENKEDGDEMIIIYRPEIKTWKVESSGGRVMFEDEKKTKSAIISSAKRYMRTH